MALIDIAILKTKQDERDVRSRAALARCKDVHQGIIERLTAFANEAIREGLRHVKPCRSGNNKGETLVTLHGWDLVIILGDAANVEELENSNGSPLTARIFVYAENLSDKPLVFDVVTFDNNDRCEFRIAKDGTFTIWGHSAASQDFGRSIAEHMISYIYDFEDAWVQMPPLAVWRDRTTGDAEQQAIGFTFPKRV